MGHKKTFKRFETIETFKLFLPNLIMESEAKASQQSLNTQYKYTYIQSYMHTYKPSSIQFCLVGWLEAFEIQSKRKAEIGELEV